MADMFIKIDGIAGESQDEVHRGEIDVASWHWKMAQQSSIMSGSGGGAGKATVCDWSSSIKLIAQAPISCAIA
jgi:type VI secretion system secreted protein Hcp